MFLSIMRPDGTKARWFLPSFDVSNEESPITLLPADAQKVLSDSLPVVYGNYKELNLGCIFHQKHAVLALTGSGN